MLRNLLAATTVLLILLSLPANAAPDALPGGACSPDGLVQRNGGAETAGVGHTLVCQGGTWKAAITFNGAGQLTELGNQTCAATEILKFDGTKWACAADDAGTGADNLGNHIATTTLRSDTHNTDDLGTTAIRWKDGWFQGTVTGGTFAGSGASLTALNATNLGSGTLPDARFPATLPAISGVNLTNLNASNLASGTVGTARLGSGTANNTTYLRGDGQWIAPPSGADNLGAGGTTTGTLYTRNASGYGYVGSEGGATGAYMRFDGSPAASAGRVYVNLLGTWEYLMHSDYFAPYATNVNDLGTSSVRWQDGWFSGTVTAGTFAGSGASLTGLPAANLTGTLPAISGANLTNLNASNLASGTVATARLGSGTANSTTFLRGDGTWVVPAGGGPTVFNAGSSTSINWTNGTTQYTTANCGAFTLSNMADGASYSLIVQGTTSGTCSFSHTGLSIRMPPGHGATAATKHTLYSFTRAGSNVYVTWIKGY